MKSIKIFAAIILFTPIFLSCSNSETDEELQILINNQENFQSDTGTDPLPPIPPKDPKNGG
ncbi:MAG: hypothetical protein CVU08_13230 [Bacteroidetes bacterium HGW-Bacteroidetes-3]|nr:MAG: hypothetical protein CVU08_13230 [Bacteroidetes bacterium HGW-Bacteroidetes-3]